MLFLNHSIETTNCEYKLDLETAKPKSWLKTVVAFANTVGGHIYFGVTNDTHDFVGLQNTQATASKIAEYIAAHIQPAPRYSLQQIAVQTGNEPCIDLYVQNGPFYPYAYTREHTQEVYVRHGDRSCVASHVELNDLLLKGRNLSFDQLPSPFPASDVSFTLLSATYKKVTTEDLSFPRDLVSMGLLTPDGQVTNAGLLLCDQGYLRQSKIVCTRWKGFQKGTIDSDALDDQEYREMSLISLLSNAEAFIRNNSNHPWTIRGMRREEKSDYPFRAVREVLVNAMIHRDYQYIGSEIHVDIFDDRLEITSPGGMYSGNRIQDLDLHRVPSLRRNEIISDIFGRLHYMERRGSGIWRVIDSYTDFAEKPKFSSDDTSFNVMLPNRSVAKPSQVAMDEIFASDKRPLSEDKRPLSEDKRPLSEDKRPLSKDKRPLSEDKRPLSEDKRPLSSVQHLHTSKTRSGKTDLKEVEAFKMYLQNNFSHTLRQPTIENLTNLFKRYRYEYSFNRRNIATQFSVNENTASHYLQKFIALGIICKKKRDDYGFIPFSE